MTFSKAYTQHSIGLGVLGLFLHTGHVLAGHLLFTIYTIPYAQNWHSERSSSPEVLFAIIFHSLTHSSYFYPSLITLATLSLTHSLSSFFPSLFLFPTPIHSLNHSFSISLSPSETLFSFLFSPSFPLPLSHSLSSPCISPYFSLSFALSLFQSHSLPQSPAFFVFHSHFSSFSLFVFRPLRVSPSLYILTLSCSLSHSHSFILSHFNFPIHLRCPSSFFLFISL